MSDYIKPRKKTVNESKKENLIRRIEENIEFWYECNNKYMVSFFEEIKHYIYTLNEPPTCKTCGYRNKLNGHCTLKQLSKPVDDDYSCDEWESGK